MATELRVREDCCSGAPVDFEEQYGALYRPTDAPLPYAGEWRDHFERCRSANDGHAAAGQRYDDGAAAGGADAPPLGRAIVVDVSKEDGSGVVECSVQGGDARAVVVKPPGGAQGRSRGHRGASGGGGSAVAARRARRRAADGAARPGVRDCVEIHQ